MRIASSVLVTRFLLFFWQFDRKSVLASGFAVSSNLDYEGYHKNMDKILPPQSAIRYGLHPNVDIAFVVLAGNMLHMSLELQFKYSVTKEWLQTEFPKLWKTRSVKTQSRLQICHETVFAYVYGFIWGFLPPTDTNFNRIRYFNTCFFAGIKSEICSEESLVYVRQIYALFCTTEKKKILLECYNILIALCHLGSFIRLQNAIISKL